MRYKYELLKGSKHFICPACHHKTFKPYVLSEDGKTWAGSEFGRCERINSCRYLRYPNFNNYNNFNNYKKTSEIETKKIIENSIPDYIDKSIVEETFNNFKNNVLARYIIKNLGSETFFKLQEKYNIGTAKNGGTIFWQQDINSNFRTGKVIYYKPDGHRDKGKGTWFVHKKIKENFNLKQCFFGEHLLKDLNENQKVALCESEKTAILMSIFEPDYIWLATGGAEMLNAERLRLLTDVNLIVYPDNGQFNKWLIKTRFIKNRKMNYEVEEAVKNGILPAGSDILDLYLLKIDFNNYKKIK